MALSASTTVRVARWLLIATAGLAAQAEAQNGTPDAVYLNGKIVTVDSRFSIAQAFAVKGDKFIAVGDSAMIKKLAGPGTQVVDLGGRAVLPGLIDAHAHVISRHQDEMQRVSLHGAQSVAEIARRVGQAASNAAANAWIVTTYIGESPDYFNLPEGLAEKRWPTRADLDNVAPRNPVYIPGTNKWPHPSVFNSAALTLIGVTRNTSNDGRVRILKDSSGEPTGVIYGLDTFNHTSPIKAKLGTLLPAVPQELKEKAIGLSFKENNAAGVTAVYEAHGVQPAFVPALRKLKEAGALTNRMVLAFEIPVSESLQNIDAWMKERSEASGSGSGDELVKMLGATVSIDGPTQFGAALMNEPYLDPHGERSNGEAGVSTEKLTEIARLAVKHDLRLNVVAAGSKANTMTVEAFETVNRETPIKAKRWVVQHFQHPTREQIGKLSAMGVVATTYSSVDFSKGAETYVRRFPGQEVWKSVVPLRWWIDGGVPIAQSTDGAHYEPMFTIWESLVRVDGRTGKSLLTPPKTITRQEAIQMYTINGAKVMRWEDRLGSIEAGKLADFVILDHDILSVPVEQIRTTKVLLTMLGGKTVYGSFPQARRIP